MDNQEFEQFEQRLAAGETLPVVEQFLFEMETKHRSQPLNALQRQIVARQESPFAHSTGWARAGILRLGNE